MKLSDFFQIKNIYKNSDFCDLGYSFHTGNKILTYCDNVHYLEQALYNSDVTSIIIKKDMLSHLPETKKGIVFDDNPRNCFFKLYNVLREKKYFKPFFDFYISKSASIAKTAIVSKKSYIGKNTIISDSVIIKDNVYIGDDCFVDVGVTIGNEGMLYVQENDNTVFIQHAGSVVIENSVTLLSNSVVVKSVFPNMPTTIGHHSIVGIATTIGHEAYISNNCKILGNCVVAKNVHIGEGSIVGSSSVLRENISLGKHTDVKAGSVVVKDVCDDDVVSGNFAYDHLKRVKNYVKEQQ